MSEIHFVGQTRYEDLSETGSYVKVLSSGSAVSYLSPRKPENVTI